MFIWLYLIGGAYIALGYILPRISYMERFKLDDATIRFYSYTLLFSGGVCLITAICKTLF